MELPQSFRRLSSFLKYWYLQWELATAIYMMEPYEKAIIHSILFAIIGIVVYAGITYIPPHFVSFVPSIDDETGQGTE